MGRVEAVADYRRFSSEFDFVRRASLYTTLCHHLSADVLVAVKRECDLPLVPRLQMTRVRQDFKRLQKQKVNQENL